MVEAVVVAGEALPVDVLLVVIVFVAVVAAVAMVKKEAILTVEV